MAVFAIGGCVGDPPDDARENDGGGGTERGPGTGDTDAGTSHDGSAPSDGGVGGGPNGGKVSSSSCANVDGGGACEESASTCCAIQDASGIHNPTYACAAEPSACSDFDGGVAVQCRSGSDCGGGVCCGRKAEDNTGVFATVMCEPSCTGVYSAGQDMFCDPNDPHACDSDHTAPFCEPSLLLPGLFYCSND